jgi:hypothetical protein
MGEEEDPYMARERDEKRRNSSRRVFKIPPPCLGKPLID